MSSKPPILSASSEEQQHEEEVEEDEQIDGEEEEVETEQSPDSNKMENNLQVQQSSDDGSGSDSESTTSSESSSTDPKSSRDVDDFKIVPIVSKPINANANTAADDDEKDEVLMPTNCSTKRPIKAFESADEISEPKKKKKKKIANDDEEDEDRRELVLALPCEQPQKWIPRLWTEKEEIVILEGMIGYIENGGDPFVNAVGFLETIKKSLHFDPTVKQLKAKIRKLNTKCNNIVKRAKIDKKGDPVILNPHELRSYRLWKQIWGSNDGKRGAVGVGTRKKEYEIHDEKGVDLNLKISLKVLHPCRFLPPWLNDLMGLDLDLTGKRLVKEQSDLIEKRKLKVEAVRAYLNWTELLREKALKIVETLES